MPARSRPRRSHRTQDGSVVLRLAMLLLAVLVVTVVALVALGVVPTGGGDPESGQPTHNPSDGPPPSGPGLALHVLPPAPPVLASVATASARVSVTRLKRHLAPLLTTPALRQHLTFAVAQLGVPSVHLSSGPQTTIPASTLKLLTTTAALSALGPDRRFTTAVVSGGSLRSLVLVGGGDPLLASVAPDVGDESGAYPEPASLEELANETASRLVSHGVGRVRLGYDASLFSGPAVNPRWPSTYIPQNVVSPISALWVEEGRETAGFAQRSADPALAAAETFRSQLTKAGVTVVGDVAEQRAPRSGAPALAEVESAPLVQIVQHILEQSDNEGAEVLLRQVAIARGLTGSSANGVTALRATLDRLGVDVRGARVYDGSGLSRDDVVSAPLLLSALETDAADAHPELRGVLTGLPVAGFSGSLGYRFVDGADQGRGYVRAKTGTLTGVHGLAGLAMTRSGAALLFVAIADQVPVPQALQARADLDRIAAGLTTCAC